jgi:hypothetical protein
MIQLAYVSSSRGLFSPADIASILAVSREKNRKLGITGMLLYKGGNILQVLEGERDAVLGLFETIRNDPRHGGVIKLYAWEKAERDFPEWSMGFHDLEAEDLRAMEGFTEFFDPQFDMTAIKPSAAARLLSGFKASVR